MVNIGFSGAFVELMSSELPVWWLVFVLAFVVTVLPSIITWLVYLVNPRNIRPPLPGRPGQAEPLVSVVIAGRNESATIGQCIRGALLCGYPNLEVIFVDDNSNDNSVAIARRAALSVTGSNWDTGRVRIFPSPRRNGKPSSLNIGIRMARGEFIVIIDADTILAYGSVQHWLVPFRDPKVGAVAANIRVNNSAKCLLTRFQEIEYALKTSNKIFQARFNLLSLLQNSSNAANFPCVRGGGAAGAQAGAGLSWVTRSIWSTASATTPNMRWHLTLIAPQIALDVVPARFHSVERIVGHCCCYGSGGL